MKGTDGGRGRSDVIKIERVLEKGAVDGSKMECK